MNPDLYWNFLRSAINNNALQTKNDGGVQKMNCAIMSCLLALFLKGYMSGSDVSRSPSFLVQMPDGGYALRGCVYKSFSSEYDGAIVRLDASGERLWSKRYGWDTDHEYFRSIAKVSDGILVAGYTRTIGNMDGFVIKTDQNGSLLWSLAYGGTSSDWLNRIIPTSDGSFLAVGGTYSFGSGGDVIILKISSSGSVLWAKYFGGTGYDEAYDCVEVSDGYLITGYLSSGSDREVLLVKLSASGTLLWARAYGTASQYEVGQAVVAVSDGIVVAGQYNSYSSGDAMLMKTDLSGNLLWANSYGGGSGDLFYGLVSDGSDLVATGTTASFSGSYDIFILKTNSGGSVSWARRYDYGWDEGYETIPVSGGYAVGCGVGAYHSVLTVDPSGNFPGCVVDVPITPTSLAFTTTTLSLSLNTPSGMSTATPPPVNDLTPTKNEFCSPSAIVEDAAVGNNLLFCSPIAGGILFRSKDNVFLRVYSADGKMVWSGQVNEGEKRINLEPGVYLWQGGEYRGTGIVR